MGLFVRGGATPGAGWSAVKDSYVRSGDLWLLVTATHVRTGGAWAAVATGTGENELVNPPSNVFRFVYGGSKVGITWVTGQADATTRVYRRPNAASAWALIQTMGVGVETTETGYTSGQFAVAHVLGINESLLVGAD